MHRKFRWFLLFLAFLLSVPLILPAAAAASSAEGSEIVSKEQLNRPDIKIGVSTGSSAVLFVEKELPEAEIVYYDDTAAAYQAVAQGKLDAFIYSRPVMEVAIINGLSGVHLLEEDLDEATKIAVGISRKCAVPDFTARLNTFIAEIKADGTIDDMFRRWVLEEDETMPEIELPKNPEFELTVGTSGVVVPYTYYTGTELTGFDIELARRFCAWLGAGLKFKVYDYAALVPAAATGDIDCIMANLHVTKERAEALPFSDVLYTEPVAIMVRGAAPSGGERTVGKRIGIQTGTVYDSIVLSWMPDAKLSYYHTAPDLINALKAKKIDAFPADEPALKLMAAEDSALEILPDRLDSFDFAFAMPKTEAGAALHDELNAWLEELRKDGRLEDICKKWTEGPESGQTIPDVPAGARTLKLVTEGAYPPMDFFRGGRIVGFEIDLAAQFCLEKGYGLSVEALSFDGILPAIQAGKADFAASGITITKERADSVLFSVPYYSGSTMLAVLRTEEKAAEDSGMSGIRGSFHKTFLREDRWKLFVEGIGNTLFITLMSMILGTALGFALFMLCRNGNPAANSVTRFCMWLVQGMPMVVLLMILYYIVFGSLAVSGIAVAIIGFTLTFGAAVFGLLKMGVGTIDKGQYEAAYALGYSNSRTFFKIILPQALPHIMPAYRGELVALIKATAIVGYIAVQDLTKMGDIVRSRTYEAFFPLISVTVIYFVLESLLSFIARRVEVAINPKRRRRDSILRGVKTDD